MQFAVPLRRLSLWTVRRNRPIDHASTLAGVAELVDARHSKCRDFGRGGSSPSTGTIERRRSLQRLAIVLADCTLGSSGRSPLFFRAHEEPT